MDTTRYRAPVTTRRIKPWHAIIGGVAALALANGAVWYAQRGDDQPTADPLVTDAQRICKDKISQQIDRPSTADWGTSRVTREGDGYHHVTGAVDGDSYGCTLQHKDGRWRVVKASLTS